jgi:HlyD family secretion protein
MGMSRMQRLGLLAVAGGAAALFVCHCNVAQPEASAADAPARPMEARVRAEGRMVAYPGAEVTVGTDRGGTIARVLVEERAAVKRGQLLAELDNEEDRAALAEARARLVEAEASVRYYDGEEARARQLVKDRVAARQELDRTLQEKDAARARQDVAAVSVRRLEAALEKTRIGSPIDGVVIRRFVQPGETVDRGAPFVTVADLGRTRVEAEVDEYDASRVQLGAEVGVTAEGYDGVAWRGVVEEIPDAVVPRSLKPNDPGRPSDTRVLKVKVRLAEKTPLKLGQRVEVEIRVPRG